MLVPMGETTLKKPAAAPRRSRGEWDELIRLRESLNDQRLAAGREAERLKGQVDELDAELMAFVEREAAAEREQRVTLKSFILSIVWVKPAAISLAFKAYGKLSKDEKAELAEEVGEKKKLDIQWRDERPGTPAAAA
jgi:hypothetical protein